MRNKQSVMPSQEIEIKDFVCRMHEFQITQIPPREALESRYQLSEQFFEKMEALIRIQERKATFQKIKRGIIAAAAVIALLFMISHPQYVAEAGNRIIQWFSDHVSYQFKENTNVNYIPRYEMQYVPAGYELTKDEYYEGAGLIEYYNRNGDCISLIYSVIDGNINVYYEDKGFSILYGAQGEKIYYIKNDTDDSFITWSSQDETTVFHVSGTLSEEELLAVQAGITAAEEE